MAGPYSPDLQIVGIAKETVVGTAVAPTSFLKIEKIEPKEVLGDAYDQSLRNDMADVHGVAQTTKVVDLTFSGKVALDDLGHLLLNMYGSDVVTGTGPYVHTESLLNSGDGQPPTHTLTHFNGVETRAYTSMRLSELTFKYVLGDFVSIDAKAVAIDNGTTTKPTPSYTAVAPSAAWGSTFSVAGSTATQATDVELTIARTVEPIFTFANTQAPYKIMAGGDFKSSGKATCVYETAAQMTAYLAGTLQAIVITTTSGTSSIAHTSTQAYISDASVSAGSAYMQIEYNWTAIANATDSGSSGGSSPIKSVLTNAVATY